MILVVSGFNNTIDSVAYSDRGSVYRVSNFVTNYVVKSVNVLVAGTRTNILCKKSNLPVAKIFRKICFQEKSKGGDSKPQLLHSIIVHAMDDQGIDMTLVRCLRS